ncbi:MAG: NAD-dependent epimerase/dehydratase family protein [Bdellovibrionia bacterium]
MKVFITGIAGFLGSRIAHHLVDRGIEVSGCDNLIGGYLENIPDEAEFHHVDCQYLNALKNIIADSEVVIHTACAAYEGLSVFSPHFVTQNTFQISTTVFASAASNKVRRVINCSSMARYGDQPGPFEETMRPQPVDPYGVAKVASEDCLRILAKVHGFEFVNLVPHNIVGAHQKYDDPFRNVAAIMINLMLRGKQPIIYGDGTQKRSFTDVRDILPCFETALFSDAAVSQTINIGPDDNSVTIRELAELIADIVGFKSLDPVFAAPRPQEVKVAVCSANKARELLGYRTHYSLRESLTAMAEWMEKSGAKKFRYPLNIEILNEKTPEPWTRKMFQ